jgi:RHS repeat-associated protein
MVFDKLGTLANVKRHDYLPFGEELGLIGGRATTQGYSAADGVRQKFTQKERDNETGLDFFGARYYASAQGRFTGADPLPTSAKLELPQTWNRYVYVDNNPLRLIDPSGAAPQDPSRPSTKKELQFLASHPVIGSQIGRSDGSTNISSVAARIASSIGLQEDKTSPHAFEGSEVNAFRHVLWQAMITVNFGTAIATEAGNAHEDEIPEQVERATFIGPDAAERADTVGDLLNNETGQSMGVASPNASTKMLASAVLDQFHTTGLIISQQNPDGSVRTVLTRISDAEYGTARRMLAPLNNNGFTPSQQVTYDRAEKDRRLDRIHIQDE